MAKSDLRIDILGTVINITTDEDPEYLGRLLEKYRRTIDNVQQLSGIKDPLKTAVLTGFLLSDDLEKAGSDTQHAEQGSEESAEAERLTLGMISRLDGLKIDATQDILDPHSSHKEQKGTEENKKANKPPAACSRITAYKLENLVKHYDWGSPEWLPALMGQENPGRIPWAELWMGVNEAGPSRVVQQSKNEAGFSSHLLSELISRDRDTMLGRSCAEKYGNLPFLFKVIAVAKPLSIQAHPSAEKALEGFNRENSERIPLDAANRNYRDPRHKPELICALSPFAALCGFRNSREICSTLEALIQVCDGAIKTNLENLVFALNQDEENSHKAFLSALFSMDSHGIGPLMIKTQALLERNFPEYRGEWKLCSYLASLYPEDKPGSDNPSGFSDPGILAPLFMNIMELKAGEAMYIPTGVLHAYIHGMGIELMADSDNVLRAGLTTKHIDREELSRILNFSEYLPEILKAPVHSPSRFSYPRQYEEFTLSTLKNQGDTFTCCEEGPSIMLVTRGNVSVSEGEDTALDLRTGESAFIPAGKNLVFSGNFSACMASCRYS